MTKTTSKRILLADGSAASRRDLGLWLEEEAYQVTTTDDGRQVAEISRSFKPDLLILDVILPGLDGPAVCEALRQDRRCRRVRTLMLLHGEDPLGRDGLGTGLGADAYAYRPLDRPRLLAKVVAILHRRILANVAPTGQLPIQHGGLHVDPIRHLVQVDGEVVHLTPLEFKILHFLARRPGWVYTRERIIDRAQGEDVIITERTVDVHVVALRKKLGPYADRIETVRGVGYRFAER